MRKRRKKWGKKREKRKKTIGKVIGNKRVLTKSE
jgi:hypothetical protein